MTVESGSGRNRRLKGRAVTFRRVEAFIRQHPQLHPDQVAELSRITRDFLEAPSSERARRRRLRSELTEAMRQFDGGQRRS